MILRRALTLVAAAALVAGCSQEIPPPQAKPDPAPGPSLTAYEPDLEPAKAVLPLVPEQATTLRVTDFDEVRELLGQTGLTGASPQADRDAFWARAVAEAPLLSTGRLRPVEARLSAYSLTQDDVSWEAEFTGAPGSDGDGLVLKFRDDLDMAAVQAAVDAGVGPLAGASVRPDQHLVVRATTDDPAASWGASADLVALVGVAASATYVARGCVTDPQALAGLPAGAELEDLDGFSVAFQGTLATARLAGTERPVATDPDRTDLFTRMRLALADTASGFPAGFADGVADPSTGRIGYEMLDPRTAVDLTRDGVLPFAVCASA